MTTSIHPFLFEWYRMSDQVWGRGVAWAHTLADAAASVGTRYALDPSVGDVLRVEPCVLGPASLGETQEGMEERQREALTSEMPPRAGYERPRSRATFWRIGG